MKGGLRDLAKSTVFKCDVLAESVAVRSGPGKNYQLTGDTLSRGETFYSDNSQMVAGEVWLKSDTGYVCASADTSKYISYTPYTAPTRAKSISAAASGIVTSTSTMFANASDAIANLLDNNPAANRAKTQESQSAVDAARSSDDTIEQNLASGADVESIYEQVLMNVTRGKNLAKRNMRLFGLPYQFRPEIDKRVKKVSPKLGRKFIENIVNEAPVVTILPGVPKYLPNSKNKDGTGRALIAAAVNEFGPLKQALGDEDTTVRYYDFQNSYTEYMHYVNMMCRTAATFLQLSEEELDGKKLTRYDWRDYRWTGESFEAVSSKMFAAISSTATEAAKGMINTLTTLGENALGKFTSFITGNKEGESSEFDIKLGDNPDMSEADSQTFDSIFQSSSFVQFYVDPNIGSGESGSNSTAESKIKGTMDSGSDAMKELAFIMNSGSADISKMQEFTDESLDKLAGIIGGGGSISTLMQRLLDVSGNIIKGENIIMPEYYTNSSYDRRYSLTIHLKAPYGNKFAYYMDVLVPMFHALCLALPRQTTANTYGAPFIVKALCEGVFSCNLGIVSSFSIDKNVAPEAWTNDGFPSEIDVSLEIVDLYSDLTISPTTNPTMFLNNTSLIEYLATVCGLNITQPQLGTRLSTIVESFKSGFTDIPTNLLQEANQMIENMLHSWVTLNGR